MIGRPRTEGRPIRSKHGLRPWGRAGLLALLLSGCVGDPACVPPPSSSDRAEFRGLLRGAVHVPHCLGPTRPARLEAQEGEVSRHEDALLARIRASPLSADLDQAISEEAEWSRHPAQADCIAYDWDHPDSPGNIAEYQEQLDARRTRLRRIEAAFARLTAACEAG